MGNKVERNYYYGFNVPPNKFLKEFKRNNKHIDRKVHNYLLIQPFPQQNVGEEIVCKFLMRNPLFLDNFIKSHVSIYRLEQWIKTKEKEEILAVRSPCDDEDNVDSGNNNLDYVRINIIVNELIYPSNPPEDEILRLLKKNEYSDNNPPVDIESHLFSNLDLSHEKINLIFMYMLENLLGENAFSQQKLAKFLANMQVNYFNIPYHNYCHAIGHAQSTYWILRNNPGLFNELEIKTLMIAALAHDIGHPGYGEEFPLNVLKDKTYGVPYLEKHHLQTVYTILLKQDANIFSYLSNDEFKEVIEDIKSCILSTYVKHYGDKIKKLKEMNLKGFNKKEKNCRLLAMDIIMIIADLSSSWKRWKTHLSSTWAVYDEFYDQGEKMEKFGIQVVSMMQRKQAKNMPSFQVAFLENLILPLLHEAAKLFPCMHKAIIQTEYNRKLWYQEMKYFCD